MICLKPIAKTTHKCPDCRENLSEKGFLITGMRNLADLRCSRCSREFYGDLPAGQALYTPILLDKFSGDVYDSHHAAWFSKWLSESYLRRTSKPLGFRIKKFSETKNKVVLLNCLDVLYGHSLLKLLNAQYYIDRRDISLIVMLPSFLEWMLPEGAAEGWIVDLPLKRGTEWNDWLVTEIEKRLAPLNDVFLSVAFSHPLADDFKIEKFTRVKPFPLAEWKNRLNEPCITFIWRDDRTWKNEEDSNPSRFRQVVNRSDTSQRQITGQSEKVINFAENLRTKIPNLNFAVAGMGEAKGLPDWILDLRSKNINEETERLWCERYAASHLVVGVHGSNMLLPSAHAGAVLELIGEDRQGNFLQDILFQRSDFREMLFRYRFVPLSTSPDTLSGLAATMLRYDEFRRLMSPEFCTHEEPFDFSILRTTENGR